MTLNEIEHIIQTGKLSGYSIGGGFLQVQWKIPQLEQGEFWLFKFTSADNKLLSVKNVSTRYPFSRWQDIYTNQNGDLIRSFTIKVSKILISMYLPILSQSYYKVILSNRSYNSIM